MTKIVLSLILLSGLFGIIKSKYSTNDAPKTTNNTAPLQSGFAVVELFTSEGCSSCPPADDILRGYADRDNVLALSFHVTYWNRLGWKDPFSQPEFDERQYNYGTQFQLNGVYTPQVVINGSAEMVGSKKAQIEKSINQALAETSDFKLELSKILTDKKLTVNYKLDKTSENMVLNLALVERDIETKVLRGENGGRTLKHDNVVRVFKTLKIASNTQGDIDFILDNDFKIKDCSVIGYLQNEKTGKIIGGVKMGL